MTATHTTVTERLLAGNYEPLREEVTATELPVTGALPRELDGRLLRIGPNSPVPDDPASFHWFLGSGMVHGLRLRDGRAEWYRNRFVRDDVVDTALGLPGLPGPRRGIAREVANITLVGHAGRLLACAEGGPLPVLLDAELRSLRRYDFDGGLPRGFTGHPKVDPATGEMHAIAYDFTVEGVTHITVDRNGRVTRLLDIARPASPMVHDMALTARHAVLLDLPVTFSMEQAAAGRALPYVWTPDYGARVGLVPREGDGRHIAWCELPEPVWVFHPLNAHDLPDGRVEMIVAQFPRMFADDPHAPTDSLPTLARWTCDPARGTVTVDGLDDAAEDFPRHDERRTARPVQYAYTVGLSEGVAAGTTRKRDLTTGHVDTFDHGPGRVAMEAVFVPRDDTAAEDGGYLLAYVYDATTDGSDVVVLPAQDIAAGPIATVHLPQRVPFGFHSAWLPGA